MPTRVDCSTDSHVPWCDCGWRGPAYPVKTRAVQLAAQHRATAHPEDTASAQNLRRQLARAGSR